MSWLSGGLNQFSNLTDQISSFTKEVLTETTEEVADPVAELDVLRQKHQQLKQSHQCLEAELLKLKEHSDEQKERNETAEYQISTITQEYRKLVDNRDSEIRQLKTENEKLREEAKGLMFNSAPHPDSPLKQLADLQLRDTYNTGREFESVDIGGGDGGRGEWLDQYHEDFSDIISSQAEINHLRSELAKVKLELQCCKSSSSTEGKVERTGDVGVDLKQQVEDLEACLEREKNHHLQELASLQGTHHQRLHSLTLRHQQEVGQLQEQVDRLLNSPGTGDYKTQELEDLNLALVSQLNQLKADYRKEQKTSSERALQLEAEEVTTSQLREKIKALNEHSFDQENPLVQEKEKLKLHIQEMQGKISEHQKSMFSVQEEYERIKVESRSLQEQVDSLSSQLSYKDREICSLKEELELHVEQNGKGCTETVKTVSEQKENELGVIRRELENARLQEGVMKAEMKAQHKQTEVALAQVKRDLDYYKKAFEGKHLELEETVAPQVELNELQGSVCKSDVERSQTAAQDDVLMMQNKIQSLEQERSSRLEELQATQQQNTKHAKQLANLKDHLLEIQDQHAEEAIKADKREGALKVQVTDLHDKCKRLETRLEEQTSQQLLQLATELQAVKEERDDALLKLTNAQQQADMNAESLRNLQTVLEQFQRDQSSELGQALKKSQIELSDAHADRQRLMQELKSFQEELEEARAAAEVASILNQELEQKEARIKQLSEEGEKMQLSLRASQSHEVDRKLMKNLIIGYVHATKQKQPEVLHLIAKILDFSPDELEQVLGGATAGASGWLTGLWSAPSTPAQGSLSQLFIKFLESESSLPSPVAASRYIDPNTDPDKPSLSTAALPSSEPQVTRQAEMALVSSDPGKGRQT